MADLAPHAIPTAAISRMVTYFRLLEAMEASDQKSTTSTELAGLAQVSAFQVRKDLAYFGRFGRRGVGYTVKSLKRELTQVLGLNRPWNVIIVGVGRLGQAIANYPAVGEYQFASVGFFDVSAAVVGQLIQGVRVQHLDELPAFVTARQRQDEALRAEEHSRQQSGLPLAGLPAAAQAVDMAFLAVPPDAAQQVAEVLVRAGIRSILNFAPVVLQPDDSGLWRDVRVENVDFLVGLKRLAFYSLNPLLADTDRGSDTD